MNTYTFIITSLVIILLPGIGVTYTISTGITKGRKESIIAALGCTAGIIPHLIVSIGLSSLLIKINENAFNLVKVVGALYLLYLGIEMILSKSKLDFNNKIMENRTRTILCRGIMINLLNPKLTLFFFAFLPQYISSNCKSYIVESAMLGIAFMLITFLVFAGYGMLASLIKTLITKSPQRLQHMQQLFGIIFVAFAIEIAISSI